MHNDNSIVCIIIINYDGGQITDPQSIDYPYMDNLGKQPFLLALRR